MGLDEILQTFANEVNFTDAICDITPDRWDKFITSYKKEHIAQISQLIEQAEIAARIDELKSLPFDDTDKTCMDCRATSVVEERINELTAQQKGTK